jgi:hypothetical protein
MLLCVALVKNDVSEERIASIIWVTKVDELGTMLAVTSNKARVFLRSGPRLLVTANIVPRSPIIVTLTMKAICSFEMSVLTRTTLRNIPEDGILHV